MFDHILRLLAPHYCVGCDHPGALLCAACMSGLPVASETCYRCYAPAKTAGICSACRVHTTLQAVYAASAYEGIAKALVQRLKFARAVAAADDIAAVMAARLGGVVSKQSVVVTHIPTATGRVRQRGYDQAALIARRVARHLDLAYTPLLARQGQQRQVGQAKRMRQVQLRHAFRPLKYPCPSHILLVDDVLTTGSTIEAAAEQLRAAGCEHVSAVVFARA